MEVLADGVRSLSNVVSMDILRVNYHPNPRTDYATAAEIDVKWEPDKIEGMNMAGGDFIEANMDISHCTFVPIPANDNFSKNESIGRDNLVSVGVSGTDDNSGDIKDKYVYHIYYPAHDKPWNSDKDWLRPNVSGNPGGSNGTNYKVFVGGPGTGFVLQSGSYYRPDPSKRQHFRMEKGGVFWNNQLLDTSLWREGGQTEGNIENAAAAVAYITASDTFYIGSTQGLHRSRARYFFVRAVRNSSAGGAGGSTSFDHDPISGGNL